MNEFKTLDNGIEIYYSNLNFTENDDIFITVRVERWNHPYSRYEGLDYIIPSGKIQNIDNLKRSEIEEFTNIAKENEKEILRLAKENSFIDEGDNLIEFDIQEKNDFKKSNVEEIEEFSDSSIDKDNENNMKNSNKFLEKLKSFFL